MLRFKLRAFSRYRPRILTLVVLIAIAGLLVLANLSSEVRGANGERLRIDEILQYGHRQLSYGWPLVWNRYTLVLTPGPGGVSGWHYHRIRLAANVAIWLSLLAASAGLCEWLLRRYRPGPRWSLRTMLAAIAMAAAICAWFAQARNRANLQDKLIATIRGRAPRGMTNPGGETVWVERHGPRWLDVVGGDRFRRHIIGVLVGRRVGEDGEPEPSEEEDLQLLRQLARLPSLQYLFLHELDCPTPAMVAELNRFPQLRVLSIGVGRLTDDAATVLTGLSDARQLRTLRVAIDVGDDRERRACVASIGKIRQIEQLYLSYPMIGDGHLECLAGLTNLKLLSLSGLGTDSDKSDSRPLRLQRLPLLPRLETLYLEDSDVSGRDLRCLRALAHLKSLGLENTGLKAPEVAELASLESLEELAIDDTFGGDIVSPAGLESLQGIQRLKTLRITGFQDKSSPFNYSSPPRDQLHFIDESEGCLRAIDALRRSKPGIVIEGYKGGMESATHKMLPRDRDTPGGIEHYVKILPWLPASMRSATSAETEGFKW